MTFHFHRSWDDPHRWLVKAGALKWLRCAAEQGYGMAQNNLGVLLAAGSGAGDELGLKIWKNHVDLWAVMWI